MQRKKRPKPGRIISTFKARDKLIHANFIEFQKHFQDLIGATRLSTQTTKSKAKSKAKSKESAKVEARKTVSANVEPEFKVKIPSQVQENVIFSYCWAYF